jgi:methyl-accepting chemotaxis protein
VLLWYKNIRITVKLRLAFGLLAGITAFVGLGGLWIMSLLNGRVNTAYEQDLPAVSAIKEAGISQLKAMRVLLGVVLAAGDNDEIEKLNRELAKNLTDERKQVAVCAQNVHSTEGKTQLGAALKNLPQFEKGANDIVSAAKAGDIVGFRNTIKDLVPLSDQIQHSFDLVSQLTQKQAATSRLLSNAAYWSALSFMVPLVAFSGLLAVAMSFVMSSVIAGPLARTVRVLEFVAKGDLTQTLPVNSTDETGQLAQSLNRALASVRKTLQEVGRSSNQLKGASQNVALTAAELSNGAATQATNLETTASSMEQISVTIRNNAANTNRANELGSSARAAAEKGGSCVQSAVSAMEEIRRSSSEISKILSAINELAFQSNLLAVNASIEAAHAGDSGRSFAVVASEIRHLAQRSTESAREIERLIAASLERVDKGAELVNRSGEAITQIIDSVTNVSRIVNEIATASNQQSQGVEHVSSAMNKVDSVVHANSSKTHELSKTAQQLAALATGLSDTLTHFTFEGESQVSEAASDDLGNALIVLKTWISAPFRRSKERVKLAQPG